MADTIPVNPWNLAQCADAIALALEMPSEVRQQRHQGLMSSIMECNSIAWTQSLSAELDAAVTVNQQRDTVSVPRLPATKLCQEYRDTSERMFFLDYEGTLAAWGEFTRVRCCLFDDYITENRHVACRIAAVDFD